jgi:hypothetical protein
MAVIWNTPAGDLGILTERQIIEVPLSAESPDGTVSYSLLAGSLPRGLRLTGNIIKGSPTEVRKFTTSKFVIRATDGIDLEDRTFTMSVDGSDIPVWETPEGFLQVGQGENYFVLDDAAVDFQLDAYDTDEIAGDVLEYYIVPNGGELPPGLSLSRDGRITGFTEPILSVQFSTNVTGAYDTGAFDILPLDKPEANSNGFDTYLYDNTTFDYSENSQVPRRLSRFYSFIIAVSDGVNEVRRLFRMWVVTEEFLQADNSLIQVDTNLFRADNTGNRVPLWITESYLGRYRANNYITLYLDVYDPPTLSGTISYLLLNENPDGSLSQLPPGMALDAITGEIAGKVGYQTAVTKTYQFTLRAIDFPITLGSSTLNYLGSWNITTIYQANDTIVYLNDIYICTQIHRNRIPNLEPEYWEKATASSEKTFTVDIIGEIDSAIEWVSDGLIGEIKPNQPSRLFLKANSLLYGGRVFYELVSGELPPGLELLGTGIIEGKVNQFADSDSPGLTRFFERLDDAGLNSSVEDSSGMYKEFSGTWDGSTTSFDKLFTFAVKARDGANFAESIKEFQIKVVADNTKTFANLYLKALQPKNKRLEWFDFITNSNIFRSNEIYRYGDVNFGVQNELKVLIYAGIESVEAVNYIQAMSRNHYRKRIKFGDIKVAKAKDPITQETIYEVIYVEIADEYETNGKSIANAIELSNTIESKVLISYDAIKVDSDIPFASDSDHQRIFPNSIKNMRKRIASVGERDREFLPLWMRSIQDGDVAETGYVKALILCYCLPGFGNGIISRIKSSGYDFKTLDFEADRYLIDVLDGEIENKYLAFPQRGEKLP